MQEPLWPTSSFQNVFAFTEELSVPVRLRLAAMLAAPGRPMAILPRHLAAQPVPVDPEVRAQIRQAIEAGVPAETVGRLAPHRLDEVVPALSRCHLEALPQFAPSRVRLLLAARGSAAPPLAECTIGQIGEWPGFGPRRVTQLIGAAVGSALEIVASEREPDRLLTVLTDALSAGGDERDRGVFESAVLPLGPSATKPELAAALEISTEWVRRLAARAAERVGAALDQAPTELGELAATVSQRLGAAAPWGAIEEALASIGFPPLPDTRSRLLLSMAGPYREVDGHPDWVAVDPAALVGQTRRLIHEDGGVRPIDHVTQDLRIEGIAPEHLDGWLARQPVRVGDGLVVATTGRPGDVAERALHAHGRPMTVDEIAAWIQDLPLGFDELRSAPDRRFQVTAGRALALVEWGDDPGSVRP